MVKILFGRDEYGRLKTTEGGTAAEIYDVEEMLHQWFDEQVQLGRVRDEPGIREDLMLYANRFGMHDSRIVDKVSGVNFVV
jgi:hypothetical protein